jgi:3-oxoacyl-[acyl-carrier-protein] synthase III
MALSLASEEGRIDHGDKILLIGGAAGFSAAALPIIY